jgi:hypothetical protein
MALTKPKNTMLDITATAFTKNNVNTATTYATSTVLDITWTASASEVDTPSVQWNGTFYTILTTGYYILGTRFALNNVTYTSGSQLGFLFTNSANSVLVDSPEFTMGAGTGRLSGGLVTGAKFFTAGDTVKPRFFHNVAATVSFQNLEVSIYKISGT